MKNRQKKRIIMEKSARLSDISSFDRIFWRKVGAHGHFAATWSTIKDFYEIRGKHGYKLRLQRSVQHIKQA